MLATNVQYIDNVIQLQDVPSEPAVGERITYMHNERLMSGIVWGTLHTTVQRHKVDGKHPVVCEYVVEVDAGFSNLRFHIVHENQVMWGKVR